MQKKFIEEAENQCVIAIMKDCNTAKDETRETNPKTGSILDMLDMAFGQDMAANTTYKGVAKCSGGDVFKPETGHVIAGQKASHKYHKSMAKQYNRYIAMLEDTVTVLEQLRNIHIKKSLNIEENLKKYS